MKLLVFFFLFMPLYVFSQASTAYLTNGSQIDGAFIIDLNSDSIRLLGKYEGKKIKQWYSNSDIINIDVYLKPREPIILNNYDRIVIEKVIQVNELSEEEIYNRVFDWYGESFQNSESVIHYNNKETGKIRGTYIDTYLFPGSFVPQYVDLNADIIIIVKEGKFKIIFSDFKNTENSSQTLESYLYKSNGAIRKSNELFKRIVLTEVYRLFFDIENYVKNYELNSDW